MYPNQAEYLMKTKVIFTVTFWDMIVHNLTSKDQKQQLVKQINFTVGRFHTGNCRARLCDMVSYCNLSYLHKDHQIELHVIKWTKFVWAPIKHES